MVRKKVSSPKFQVYNTALISAQSHTTFEEAKSSPALWGRIVESAVGAHLLNHSIENNFILQFWREGDKEVDFIIQKQKLIAIEVKSGNKENLSGMQQFHHKYHPDKMLAIGNAGLSWKEFIRINPVELFD
jgi:predicted AAA+ superfamily ATPase